MATLEASLKQHPAVLILRIEIHRIPRRQLTHEFSHTFVSLLPQHHVEVIRHQRVCKDLDQGRDAALLPEKIRQGPSFVFRPDVAVIDGLIRIRQIEQGHEAVTVSFCRKYGLFGRAPVVNMVCLFRDKWRLPKHSAFYQGRSLVCLKESESCGLPASLPRTVLDVTARYPPQQRTVLGNHGTTRAPLLAGLLGKHAGKDYGCEFTYARVIAPKKPTAGLMPAAFWSLMSAARVRPPNLVVSFPDEPRPLDATAYPWVLR